jgi:outer membrane receptor protein involved in Fe transport
VRVPSHVDYALRYPVGEAGGSPLPLTLLISGSAQVKPERLRAIETGARWQLWKKAALEIAAFQSSYAGLNAYQTPFALTPQAIGATLREGAGSIPVTSFSGRDAIARGGEITVHYDLTRGWRLLGSYSAAIQKSHLRPGSDPATTLDEDNSYPKHMAQFRSSWDLGRRWMLDAEVFKTGALQQAGRVVLPAFTRVDFRVERKLGERSGIYVNGQNLLRPSQQEFFGSTLYPAGRIGRSIAVGLRWER